MRSNWWTTRRASRASCFGASVCTPTRLRGSPIGLGGRGAAGIDSCGAGDAILRSTGNSSKAVIICARLDKTAKERAAAFDEGEAEKCPPGSSNGQTSSDGYCATTIGLAGLGWSCATSKRQAGSAPAGGSSSRMVWNSASAVCARARSVPAMVVHGGGHPAILEGDRHAAAQAAHKHQVRGMPMQALCRRPDRLWDALRRIQRAGTDVRTAADGPRDSSSQTSAKLRRERGGFCAPACGGRRPLNRGDGERQAGEPGRAGDLTAVGSPSSAERGLDGSILCMVVSRHAHVEHPVDRVLSIGDLRGEGARTAAAIGRREGQGGRSPQSHTGALNLAGHAWRCGWG